MYNGGGGGPYSPYGTGYGYQGAGLGGGYYGGGMSPYGNGGGAYGAPLFGAPPPPPPPPPRSTFDSLWHSLNTISDMTGRFVRMSHLLDANWHGIAASWGAMTRLVEGLKSYRKEIFTVTRALLAAKLIHSLYVYYRTTKRLGGSLTPVRAALAIVIFVFAAPHMSIASERSAVPRVGLRRSNGNGDRSQRPPRGRRHSTRASPAARGNDDADDGNSSSRSRSRSRSSASLATSSDEYDDAMVSGEHSSEPSDAALARALLDNVCVAEYAFVARHADELSLRRGDKVLVRDVGDVAGWVSAEREDGLRGLTPAVYLKKLGKVKSQQKGGSNNDNHNNDDDDARANVHATRNNHRVTRSDDSDEVVNSSRSLRIHHRKHAKSSTP